MIPAASGVTPDTITAFVREQWPESVFLARCVEVSGRHSLVTTDVPASSLRPGGFISGPTQFSLADLALWYATFGAIGLEPMAMTSELSIRFARPAVGDRLWGRANLHSVGSRRFVGTVTLWTDDPDKPTAVCQGTYVSPRGSS